MDLIHRPLEEKDAQHICGFASSAEELFFAFPQAGFPLTTDTLMETSGKNLSPTVILLDERAVAYASFIKVKEKGFCAISNLMVDPGHRRKGVATHLINLMVREATAEYCARFVRATCFSHNQAAYQLFHKLGFRPAEMEQHLTSEGTPVLMVNLYLHRGKVDCGK